MDQVGVGSKGRLRVHSITVIIDQLLGHSMNHARTAMFTPLLLAGTRHYIFVDAKHPAWVGQLVFRLVRSRV